MPQLGHFRPEFEKNMSYLKLSPPNLSKYKVHVKKIKFVTKILSFG